VYGLWDSWAHLEGRATETLGGLVWYRYLEPLAAIILLGWAWGVFGFWWRRSGGGKGR
jgi:hypothetical protein